MSWYEIVGRATVWGAATFLILWSCFMVLDRGLRLLGLTLAAVYYTAKNRPGLLRVIQRGLVFWDRKEVPMQNPTGLGPKKID